MGLQNGTPCKSLFNHQEEKKRFCISLPFKNVMVAEVVYIMFRPFYYTQILFHCKEKLSSNTIYTAQTGFFHVQTVFYVVKVL